MRSRRRTHHSHVAWSGSDEEFQSQTPQPAWDAAWDRVRAERKQAGLPNTYDDSAIPDVRQSVLSRYRLCLKWISKGQLASSQDLRPSRLNKVVMIDHLVTGSVDRSGSSAGVATCTPVRDHSSAGGGSELRQPKSQTPACERESLELRRAGRILAESPSRFTSKRIACTRRKKIEQLKVKSGNSKPISSDDALKRSR